MKNKMISRSFEASRGYYNIVFGIIIALYSCTESSVDRTCQKSKGDGLISSISAVSEMASYPIGFELAVRKERTHINGLVLNWHFIGQVVKKDGNTITLRIESTNTPKILPKEYIPNFEINELEQINSEMVIAELKVNCNDKTIMSKISVGNESKKDIGTSFVGISSEKIELTP